MRIIFAGTPEVSVTTLRALVSAGHDVCAVLTRPDAPLGRKRILTPSPVALAAVELGLPVIRASRVDAAVSAQLSSLEADLGVVVAFGGLLPQEALAAPRGGWINLHFSALPRWRGAAPVQWSLIAGDTHIGTTVFRLVEELDAGDIYSVLTSPLGPEETSKTVLTRLSQSGALQVCDVVSSLHSGQANATPQVGEVTYARKLVLADAHLVTAAPREVVYAQLRGVTPEPGAFVTLAGENLKLLHVSAPNDALVRETRVLPGHIEIHAKRLLLGTSTTPLEVHQVQPSGKPRMDAGDWFRGLQTRDCVVVS